MMKHIGKHNQKQAVILWKQVPNEDHMALIIYPETLPRIYHDAVMRVVESAPGQNSVDIADPLGRELMADGRNILAALHSEGLIRKVQTKQVVMTPKAGSTVRLDELNKILAEMATGKDAVARLAEIDSQAGMYDPNNTIVQGEAVLSDESIAQDQLSQADQMDAQAKVLVGEAKNLRKEAYEMAPSLKPKATRKKAAAKKSTGKRSVGRPRKATAK